MNSAKKIMNQQNSDSEKKSNTVAKAATSKTRLGKVLAEMSRQLYGVPSV